MMMNLPSFYKQPSLIKATYQINTPMFAAGAEQKTAELTPTAFKGVLRFWWRALNWSAIYLQSNNKSEALKQLHKQEAKLFGVATADNRKNQGQGACLVNTLTLSSDKQWQYTGKQTGVNYLLGQGLTSKKEPRYAIDAGQSFTVELTVEPEYHDKVIDVLTIIGLLGGFGSRSRHGLGSVTLQSIEKKTLGDESYQAEVLDISNATVTIQALLSKYRCQENTELPPLSAFYADTCIDVVNFGKRDAIEVLQTLGTEEQMYRSYGRNGKVVVDKVDGKNIEKNAERNFVDDHDLIYQLSKKSSINAHPKRAVFGLPHNYYFSSNNLKVDIDSSKGRRASPLIQHVHYNGREYQLIQCLLKSEFLPTNSKIEISAKGNKSVKTKVSPNVDWSVITDFMDRPAFANKETV